VGSGSALIGEMVMMLARSRVRGGGVGYEPAPRGPAAGLR
jgi:hypothetical protein